MRHGMKLLVVAVIVCAFGSVHALDKEFKPAPPFDSFLVAPADQGKVKPIRKSDTPVKIAVIGMENSPFWLPVKEGALRAKKTLEPFNCTVDWIVPAGEQHTADFYGVAIDACVAQHYDAIATIAGDSGIVEYINNAVDSGIPVATFNVETTTPNKRLFFVGADLYLQGRTAGEYMAKLLEGKDSAKIAVQTGFFSVEGLEQRRLGFEEALAELAPGAQIVSRVETLDRNDVAYSQAQDFLTAFPDLDALFVASNGAAGSARAFEEAGVAGKVKIVCYDFMDEVMEHVATGAISGTIGQGPFSQGHDPAIRLFNYIVADEVPEAARLFNEMPFVTRENYQEHWTPLGGE